MSGMDPHLQTAAEIIRQSSYVIALTGAGISVESGIPDFRSAGGLWETIPVYAIYRLLPPQSEMIGVCSSR